MSGPRFTPPCLVPLLLLRLTIASELEDVIDPVFLRNFSCGPSVARIVPLRAVPRYQAVQFLVVQDMRSRSEVRAFNFSYQEFYAHVFEAFSLIDDDSNLSMAAIDDRTDEIVGVNLVLRYPKLSDMYAPNAIHDVSFSFR